MKHTKQIKCSLLKKTAALATSVIMLVTSLSFPELKDGFKDIFLQASAAVDSGTININYPLIDNLEKLYKFSEAYYNNPGYYQRARVEIAITEAIEISETYGGHTWHPIGGVASDGKEYPFGGVIYIATTGTAQNFTVNLPLFGSIYDSVETYELTQSYAPTNPQKINLVRNADAETALFAEKVVSDPLKSSTPAKATPARWDLTISGSGKYTGIINTVDENAEVNLDLTLNSAAAIESSGNAGIICGTMNEGSKVNAVMSGSSTGTISTVTSTDGSAGGLVGEMCQGSELDIVPGTILTTASSRTINGNTYAGGLVGKNDQGTVVIKQQTGTDTDGKPIYGGDLAYDAKGNVYANTESGYAGGVFGYYKVPETNNKFSSDYYNSTTGCTLKGKTVGGLVGMLEGNGNDIVYSGTASSRVTVKSNHSDSSGRYGGIAGIYSNTSLEKKFEVEYVDVEMNGTGAIHYGGVLGSVSSEQPASAVYVKVNNFTLNSKSGAGDCTDFGGVIGHAGTLGSMFDVGTVTITTSAGYKGGGIVGALNKGVLRLSGTTDLSAASAASGGQIVGERTDALVYALGNGNSGSATYENGWRFVRSLSDNKLDDIGTWGEVLRIANVEDKDPADTSDSILVYNSTAHTVTVASEVLEMRSAADAVKTALNMQLNNGSHGALRFNSSSDRTTLLGSNLTVLGSISFSGTGVTGFMRDGSTSAGNAGTEIGSFTGKLSKGTAEEGQSDTAVITLAVGENYGIYSSGNDNGAIHQHTYNGLFARTGDGATIEDITIDGTMNINANADDIHVGGAISFVKNSATISNVSISETINYKYYSGSGHYVGGLIGSTSCDEGKTVSVSGSSLSNKAEISPVINVTGTCLNNDDTNVRQSIAGLIGYIGSTAGTVTEQTNTSVSNIKLSANIDASGATASANESIAGLIADIAWSATDTRKLSLSYIDVDGTTVKSSATGTTGGILGYRWFGTDVEFSGVELKSSVELNSPAAHIGGLVYKATGNWLVTGGGITINALDIKNGSNIAAPDSLGIIVHDGYYSSSGIFLELLTVNSFYLASGLTIPDMTGNDASGKPKKYDELVVCLSSSFDDLLKNNTSGVISYATSQGEYSMGGAGTRNSYNNVYNTTVVNNRSRYYYNADRDSFTNNSGDDSYKLLSWSLNRYAAANIKRCFNNPFSNNVLSGDFDLNHISYYPIDIDSNVTIGESTFVFYNDKIETTETASDTKRSTRDGKSQHYLMHMGLFKNVTATIETTDDINIYGSVGVDSTYSGAFINGTLTGTLKTAQNARIVLGKSANRKTSVVPLTLVGTNINERFLLINSIGNKAILDLNGVVVDKASKYCAYDTTSNTTYASSLIGDVKGVGINLKFNNIRLDGRNQDGVVTGLDIDVYGTTRSIFNNATLLNSYDVDSTSVAIYNFSQSDDWYDEESHTDYEEDSPLGVTYGKELTDTVEYRDDANLSEENRYYEDGESGNFIDPENYPTASTTAYDFSTNFLPYVRYYNSSVSGAPTPDYALREIKVNVVPSDLRSGCGTYDHPYVITGSKQLIAVANMLDAQSGYTPIPNIMLPTNKNDTSHWCLTDASTHSCKLYTYNSSKYTATGSTTWETDDVRKYLAKAYYQIGQDITLGTAFTGLGAYDSSYAFKGVIVGLNSSITITNKSCVPFIKVSNGSVIKGLKITVDNYANKQHQVISSMTRGANTNAFAYNTTTSFNDTYGGVIGTIMGGDNIIDNVTMTYSSNNTAYVKVPSRNLVCVGGYVGAVVNGGLVFRNMTADNFVSKGAFNVNSANAPSTTNWVADDGYSHLYVNPYVGRVINGYAINETTSYSGDSKKYTLDNGTKNYQICDVKASVADATDATAEKLYYDTLDSKNRVNIPTGQSLFILSLITQSGAGTATTVDGNYAYDVGYDGDTKYNDTSAAANVATHLAKYDKVGTAVFADKTDTTSDYFLSKGDTLNSKTATPYIIHHYTKADSNGKYPARMMTGNTEFMKLTTAGGTYNLPKSFRGIGSICYGMAKDSTNNPYQMQIYGFDGNGATINEQIIFNTYSHLNDNYANKVYGNQNINTGMGLFNVLVQKRYSNSTTYKLDDGYYIGKFTLTGQVTVKEYTTGGVEEYGDLATGSNGNARTRYAVGGLAAGILAEGYVNLYNLDLNNLDLTGTTFVAGYIGRNNITEKDGKTGTGASKIYVNGCDTTSVIIKGSNGCCGGIVGGSISGYPSIYVNTAELKTGDTHTKGDDGYYKTTMELSISNDSGTVQSGIGGIIGTLRNGYGVVFWVNNVTIKGCGTTKGFINNTTTSSKSQWYQGAGGLFGFVRKADSIIVTNCEINNLSIKAPYAGGLFGNIDFYDDNGDYGTSPVIKIANCKVTSNSSSQYSIEGVRGAGGITGQFTSSKAYDKTVRGYKNDIYSYDVDGCEVSNYTISQTGNGDYLCGSGGLFGFARATYVSAADAKMRTVVNTSVHDCIIKTDGSKANHGMGAVIGCVPTIGSDTSNSASIVIDDSGNKKSTAKACGNVGAYNVACYNNSFAFNGTGTSAKVGNFVGKSNSSLFRVAGFTRKNNKLNGSAFADDYGDSIASGSYIIDADYMNVSMTDGHGTLMAVGFDNGTNVGEGARKEYFPYVTVSPNICAGGTSLLTGDGVSIVDNEPLASTIVSEYEGSAADNRIKYSNVPSSDIEKVKEMLGGTNSDIKITTYDSEMGLPAAYENNEGEDFPIIAIGGALTDYNDYINAYIRTLTNTAVSYNQSSSNFSVDLYPCKCINGVYQRDTTSGAVGGLQLQNNKFVYVDEKADSIAGQNQFTMIDIRFFDPTDSTKTAYHLYVPVLTKKLLKFNFSSAALQGTEYEAGVYQEKIDSIDWGEITKLGAGFDSWQTIYVQFEYTKDEVNKFLDSGEKRMNWNAPKRIQFKYQGDRSIADSTQFVLLDNNNGVDKEYYLTKQDDGVETAISADQNAYDVINFGEFTTDINNASQITPSQKFSDHIQTLNDIAGKKIVYSTAPTNGAYVLCADQANHTDADVYAYDKSDPSDASKKWFRAYTSTDTGTRYKLEITDNIVESYYLSMYTFKEDNINSGTTNNAYGFIVDCPMTITSDVITCQRDNAKNTEIYLGKFLKQTMIISKQSGDYNENDKISTENNIIKAKLIATVEFDAGAPNLTAYFYKKLINEKLHQGYILYLNKYDKDGNLDKESTITGNKTYSVVSKRNGETVKEYGDSITDGEPYLYIEPIPITVTEQNNDQSWISTQEVEINLTFEPDETTLITEFTSRSNDSDRNGVQLDAAARLDFAKERVPYSNNIQKATDFPGTRYYVDRSKVNGKLSLNAIDQPENDEYDPYGEQSHNKSALGINAKYIDQGSKYPEKGDTEYINVGMDYDISQLPEDEIFDGNHALKLTIKLNQKQNAGNTSGFRYQPVNIQDADEDLGYLENFKLIGKPNTSALSLTEADDDGYLYYTYTMPLPQNKQGMAIQYNTDNKHFNANFEFDVKTAAKLEAIPGYKYANYKFEVTAEITGSSYSSNDHIIYTNAKVNAEYVKKKAAG